MGYLLYTKQSIVSLNKTTHGLNFWPGPMPSLVLPSLVLVELK
jgi:hypothetical protein